MASKQFEPGDTILRCMPFCHALTFHYKGSYCDYCFAQKNALKACASCHVMHYCNHDCQKKDWRPGHKLECPLFTKTGKDRVPEDLKSRYILRLYLLTKNPDIASKKCRLYDGKERCFRDLVTHEDKIRGDVARNVMFSVILRDVKAVIGDGLDEEHLFKVFCAAEINHFSISSEFSQELGIGLYLEASIFDHTCYPDARGKFHGSLLEIRAEKMIRKGKVIFISYIAQLEKTRSVRNDFLRGNYYFACHCAECDSTEDDSAIREEFLKLDQDMKREYQLKNFKKAYKIGMKLVPVLHRVYGQYHPQITSRLIRTLQTGGACGYFERDDFVQLTQKVEESTRVTEIEGGAFWETAFDQIKLVRNPLMRSYAPMVFNSLDKFA